MPSHQDRRDPLPADYQFGDAGRVVLTALRVERAKLTPVWRAPQLMQPFGVLVCDVPLDEQ